jgi:ATP-dependent DNA helicase RecG
MVLRVFPGPQKPYFIKKLGFPSGVYCRFGAHNRVADEGMISEFTRQRQGRSYEQELVPKISFGDLDKEILKSIIGELSENSFIAAGYGEIDVSGRCVPNVAGTLLFYRDHIKQVGESYLTLSHYAGSTKKSLIKTHQFDGGLHHIIEMAYSTLEEMFQMDYVLTGSVKKARQLEVPATAIRELIVNAVAHRRYDIESPIRISVFSDRMEVLNPGSFYAPIHSANLKEGLSRYRNIRIGDALRRTGHMEKQGIGISTIIESCLDHGLPEPQFLELDQYLKVIISRKRINDAHLKSVVSEKKTQVNDIEDLFRKYETISSSELAKYIGKSQAMAKKILQQYKEQHLIIKIGNGPSTRYQWLD